MKPPSRINARLDQKAGEQMAYLQDQTKLTVSEIVRRAIDCYARSIREAQPSANALMKRAGFAGCAEGPENLAESAKEEFSRGMRRKHGHR